VNRLILFAFFYYSVMEYWREIDKLLTIEIKAKSQRAAKYNKWSYPLTTKGQRRLYRGPDPRGKQAKISRRLEFDI